MLDLLRDVAGLLAGILVCCMVIRPLHPVTVTDGRWEGGNMVCGGGGGGGEGVCG